MTNRYRTLLVVSIALMTVVGMGTVTVAAQETPTPVQNETNATANETVAADNATEPVADDNETVVAAGANETANVTFHNQSTNGTFVIVNSTELPEGGFLAIFTVNESVAENVTNETEPVENITEPAENVTNETEVGVEENVTNETEVGVEENVTNETEEEGLNVTEGNATTPTEEGLNVTGAEENATNDTEAGVTPTPQAGAAPSVVTIDEVNNSTLGLFVGNSTYLTPGTHENVLVEYRAGLRQVEDQVLIAVAYRDANENQQFDGIDNASAYMQNGTIVGDWAYVVVEEEVTINVTATPPGAAANETEAVNETEAALNETEEAATPTPAGAVNNTTGDENVTGAIANETNETE